tara:strand:+ start:224 stop:2005 length:1782 start_codon:yes stop_codon:yes gene_type:complete
VNLQSKKEGRMIVSLIKLWKQLNKRRRIQIFFLLVIMIICGLAELISLASVIPFLLVLTDIDKLLDIKFYFNIINFIGLTSRSQIILFITLTFISAAIVTALIRLLNLFLTGRIAALIGTDLSKRVYKRILEQSYSWHVKKNSSDLITTANQNTSFVVAVINALLQLITSLIIITSILIGLFLVTWKVALFSCLVFVSTYIVFSLTVKKKLRDNGNKLVTFYQKQLKILQEGFSAIREVIIDNLQEKFIDNYVLIDLPMRKREANNLFLKGFPRYTVEALGMVLIAATAYFLTLGDQDPNIVFSILGAFALGSQRLLPSMQSIYVSWADITTYFPGLLKVLNVLELPNKNLRSNILFSDNRVINFDSIILKDISFRYDDKKPYVFENLSLKLFKGQKIGLVGKTGCGKSTIIDLILGLLKPTKGTISINGINLNENDSFLLNQWRSMISHVPQTIYLFDSTIAENIAFGVEPALIDYDRLRYSARKANILGYIESLPNGFDSFIGERGVRISGGQRQRIGIARALYKKSQIMIFDEATSALDNSTEISVMDSISKIDKQLTLVLIAHRLSSLDKCDSIYEVNKSGLKPYISSK